MSLVSLHPRTAEEWAARLGAPDFSSEERAAFERWLAADATHRSEYERVRELEAFPRVFEASPAYVADLLAEVEPGGRRPVARSADTRTRSRWFIPTSIAAGCATLALAFVLAPRFIDSDLQRVATRHGEQRSLTLPDGSVVQLNTDTQIAYRVDNNERHVDLRSGEVFFDVAKDEARRFVVRTPTAEIQVVGTQFSVRTRPNDVEVIVKEGKVNVVRAESGLSPERLISPSLKVALVPGDRLRLAADSRPAQVAAVDVGRATAWRSGILDIDAMSLEDVVAEVNRYVSAPFVIEDDSIRRLQFSGRFRLGDSEAIRFMLRERLGIESEVRGEAIALRAAKS